MDNDELNSFTVEDLTDETFKHAVLSISEILTLSETQVETQLRTYLGESKFAQSVLNGHLPDKSLRILEVGGGIGWVSRALSKSGYNVTDLEPSGQGFSFMSAAREALSDEHSAPHLDIGIDQLSPIEHGTFDFIYSINVLEHVPDPISALSKMFQALNPGGRIMIMCPNYAFPFEPHFSIPLLPFAPSSTERLLPAKITESEVWGSLNWITARRVKNWAAESGAVVEFDANVLRQMFVRITSDPTFAIRHAVIAKLTRLLGRLRILQFVSATPPRFVSPMQFIITHPSE